MISSLSRIALTSVLAGAATLAAAQGDAPRGRSQAQHWAMSWIAPPQRPWGPDFVLPVGMPGLLADVTIRQSLRLSVGGGRIRLVVSNAYGDAPLQVGRAHVALADGSGSAWVTFQGAGEVLVAAGAQAVSDPVALPVPAAARLAVDLYLPRRSQLAGFHWDAHDRTLLLAGDAAGRAAPAPGQEVATRAFLGAVLVESARAPAAVVALGDSLTDGNGSTPGADRRWPDVLAQRLLPQGVAVLNAGISGNRLLRPGMGDSALARFGRDVLQQPGVQAVVVLLGTNDIGWPGGPFAPDEPLPGIAELAQGFRQLVAQARLRGVRVVAATLPPFEGALQGTPLEGHHSPAKEFTRVALNDWIRHSAAFDAVVDADRLLRDPQRASRLRPEYDSGDHLHPNDAGYRALAEAIDLQLLLPAPPAGQKKRAPQGSNAR